MSAITGTSQAAPLTSLSETGPLPASGTAAVSAGLAAASPGALYRSVGTVFAGGASGLRAPQNAEDAAILLAQAAAAIDAVRREASDARIAGAAASVRASLGGASAQLATAGTELYGDGTAGSGLIAQRGAASAERESAAAREAALATQITELQGTVATLNGTIAAERTKADAAIETLSDARDAIAAKLALIDAQIVAAQAAGDPGKVAALRAERADVEATLEAADAEIETTRDTAAATIAALTDRRDAAQTTLDGARTERATVQARIAALDTAIAALDGRIAAAERDIALGRTALVLAFAQMTALLQDRSGERALEAARSTELDRRLDEAGETLKDMGARLLERFEAEGRALDDLRAARASERILAAVLGLATGLAAVADVLRRETDLLPDEPVLAGRRQLALR